MVRTQKGGAKLIHPEKTGFTPIYDMLNVPGSRLELLTYTSLYGFMFELIVDPSSSEYNTFDQTSGRLTNPITNFILKFVVTTTPFTVRLPEYNGVKKASETPEKFLKEANTQQSIWSQSISGGRPEICPAVANMSLFDNEQSRILIYWLFFIIGTKGIPGRNEVTDVLHYLSRILTKPQCGIGVILMPKIMRSTTFVNFVRLRPNSSQIMQSISNILAQVVKLFIVNRIIHTDLHTSNVLVYQDPSTSVIKSELIDFGRVIDVNYPENLEINVKIRIQINKIISEFFRITQPLEKLDFIQQAIYYIQRIIETKNASPNNQQMVWLIKFADSNPEVYSQAFDTLKSYYVVSVVKPRLSLSTIRTYIRTGEIFNLDRPLGDFYVSTNMLNDQEYALASTTAVNTSSVQMAKTSQPPAETGSAKRKITDVAQNDATKVNAVDAEIKKFETTMFDDVDVHAESITFKDESTIFDEDSAAQNGDAAKYSEEFGGDKKSRRQRKTRIRRKRATYRRTRKRIMRKGVNGLKSNR